MLWLDCMCYVQDFVCVMCMIFYVMCGTQFVLCAGFSSCFLKAVVQDKKVCTHTHSSMPVIWKLIDLQAAEWVHLFGRYNLFFLESSRISCLNCVRFLMKSSCKVGCSLLSGHIPNRFISFKTKASREDFLNSSLSFFLLSGVSCQFGV